MSDRVVAFEASIADDTALVSSVSIESMLCELVTSSTANKEIMMSFHKKMPTKSIIL